jgi:hypothetical protein
LLLNYGELLLRKFCTVEALQHNAWPLWGLDHLGSDAFYDSTRRLACQKLLFQAAWLCTDSLFFCWRRDRCLLR